MPEQNPTPGEQPSCRTLSDRRAYVRLASDLAATCRPSGPSHDVGWAGTVRDISLGGVGLLLRHRFRPGTTLAVELRDSNGKLLRTVEARVVHVTATVVEGAHCWLHGCAFDRPLSEEEFAQVT